MFYIVFKQQGYSDSTDNKAQIFKERAGMSAGKPKTQRDHRSIQTSISVFLSGTIVAEFVKYLSYCSCCCLGKKSPSFFLL